MSLEVERAVARRESASVRVRTLTAVALVAGTGLTAALAAVAGASTHLRHVITRLPVHASRTKPVVAPAAPLVAVHEAPSAQQSAPPAPAPTPAASAPVAASGGS